MSILPNLPSCEKYLRAECEKQITSKTGIDRSKLTPQDENVCLKDCRQCTKSFRITENGLFIDNVALFWHYSDKTKLNDFCAGINDKHDQLVTQPYRFCYNETILPDIETAIKAADFIFTCEVAYDNAVNVFSTRLQNNVTTTDTYILTIFNKVLQSRDKTRKTMWNIIEEGIKRHLVPPKKASNNIAPTGVKPQTAYGKKFRMVHGNRFRTLIRNGKYNVLNTNIDLFAFGHFHLQMAMYRYNTWILQTGHFVQYRMPRKIGFLSHLGAPMFRVHNKTGKIYLEINRG